MPLDLPPTTRPAADSPTYAVVRTDVPPVIDGQIDDCWSAAPWSSDFVDIEGDAKPTPRFRTRVKMFWDDRCLYVLAELQEPHVWGTLTERNSIIFQDNDIELFLDPDGDRLHYYELEVNALNTVMELALDKPYVDGGNYRFVTLEGLQTAVAVRGTLNDPRDEDAGWTVEIALPFASLATVARGVATPPAEGDTWHANLSRVQWAHRIVNGQYVKVPKGERPEENWVWAPTGVIDMHRPERWGRLIFAGRDAG